MSDCILIIQAVVRAITNRLNNNSYGVQLRSLPDLNYIQLVKTLASVQQRKRLAFFIIGLTNEEQEKISSQMPPIDGVDISYMVEDAEESRNSGDETIFRIIIIRRHVAKVSSLSSFEEITSKHIYSNACDITQDEIGSTNDVIKSLLKALRRADIRQAISLDGLLSYCGALLEGPPEELSTKIVDKLYLLSLYRDDKLVSNSNTEIIAKRIIANRAVVQKVAMLEKVDRNSVRSYAASHPNDSIAFKILRFYEQSDPFYLRDLEYETVETCLKTATSTSQKKGSGSRGKERAVKPAAIGISMAFDGNEAAIDDLLGKIEDEHKVFSEEDGGSKKPKDTLIKTDDGPMTVRFDPIVEDMTASFSGNSFFGGLVYADNSSPREILQELERYNAIAFDTSYVNELISILGRFVEIDLVPRLQRLLELRKKLVEKLSRLQDSPMLQILSKSCYSNVKNYVEAYAALLSTINSGDYGKMLSQDSSAAKEIISKLMSLDIIYIIGKKGKYIIPTPLSPIYLWKFVELATEVFDGRDTLEEADKQFVIRKSEEMPDPLSVMLIPYALSSSASEFLPYAGRIGNVPYYSSTQQIDQQENGLELLEQAIIRYIKLYPHSSLMLRLAVVNPPSVDVVIQVLKDLNANKEIYLSGVALSIYRTTDTDSSWIELDDKSTTEGILGRIAVEGTDHFSIVVKDKKISYDVLLREVSRRQHVLVLFDPNDKEISIVGDNRYLQIHPLCIPKVFRYKSISESVEISPTNQGSIFSDYADIIERLNDRPAPIAHTGMSYRAKIQPETYNALLEKADWLIILDQSLKIWDIALQTKSQKLFFKQSGYRGVGIYSADYRKLQNGFKRLIGGMGNLIVTDAGISRIMDQIRALNEDGLLSLISHSSNTELDSNHGKGAVGLAIAAEEYLANHPGNLIVSLDSGLAHNWLAERNDGMLPDLIGISTNRDNPQIDVIEVKTYSDDYVIRDSNITGHAVEQIYALEDLIDEMFSASSRITTTSRKEILREQVFDSLLQTDITPEKKKDLCDYLNELFAGLYKITKRRIICLVDSGTRETTVKRYFASEHDNGDINLVTVGMNDFQSVLSDGSLSSITFGESIQPSNMNMQSTVFPESERPSAVLETSHDFDTITLGTAAHVQSHDSQDELRTIASSTATVDDEQNITLCKKVNYVLRSYGINALPVEPSEIQYASRFTRVTIRLSTGESVNKLERYKRDIGRELEALGEVLISTNSGSSSISMDIPYDNLGGRPLLLTDYLDQLEQYKGTGLTFIAGQAADGTIETIDLTKAPHMLIAGTTGSGKTVFLYSLLVSLIKQYTLDELELIIVDPKQTDFIFFDDLPHLRDHHVIIDAGEALETLQNIIQNDVEQRTRLLRSCRSRDIDSYNEKNPTSKMKRLVVVIDEYADLIQEASAQGSRKDFEERLRRLAQRVRNIGIHLVLATQRPSSNIVTGDLKAVLPFRISFKLLQHQDSMTILDRPGAEDLLGRGDMLVANDSAIKRLQGMYITEQQLQEFLDENANRG